MQFYALEDNQAILASEAKKGKIYSCPECFNPLRVRSGPHRQPHFYHLKKIILCRQHQKTLAHLNVQWAIAELLPPLEGILEKAFPQIGRIADVAWENKKMIFEVQYSPISLEEAQNRCRDYEKLGLIPIWVLHDRRFNKRSLSAAENFLRQRLCFFTNIDEEGKGLIYDQQELIVGYKRVSRGPPLKVDLQNPKKLPALPQPPKPKNRFSLLRIYQALFRLVLEKI